MSDIKKDVDSDSEIDLTKKAKYDEYLNSGERAFAVSAVSSCTLTLPLITKSFNYDVKVYDISGQASLSNKITIQPSDGNFIKGISVNGNNECSIVVPYGSVTFSSLPCKGSNTWYVTSLLNTYV